MKIVFMGTPEFAVASLRRLLESGINVVGVITAPDKPAGRGRGIQSSAVKNFAVEHNLQLLQPTSLKDPEFLDNLSALQADLQVVVAFRMLPEVVWNMPPKGTINLHASLLPQYRGAAPINWAIINGESRTGVSTFFLKQEIDTGDILFSREVKIEEDDSAGDLHDKLMHTGAELLVQTVEAIESGNYQEVSQDSFPAQDLKPAPKIFRDDCRIDWDRPVKEVYNHIRGLSPYPAAYCSFHGKNMKIYKAKKLSELPAEPAGTFVSDNQNYLRVACSDGYLDLQEVQLEGKKRMPVEEFLRGVRL